MTRLENFFVRARPKIDLAKSLGGKVGTKPTGPLGKKFSVSQDGIADLPIAISGQIATSAQIFKVNHAVPVLDFSDPNAPKPAKATAFVPVLPGSESLPEKAKPPENHAYTEFVLLIGAGLSVAVKPPSNQALTVAAEASTSGSLRYRLLLPAPTTDTQVEAIANLIVTARPPQLLDLRQIAPGELHTFDARFQVGFGLKAQMGQDFDFSEVIDLFDDLSATVQAHAEATLSASLGWSLYERMQIAVGKVNLGTDEPGWVRLRLQRVRRRELTLGAKLAVQMQYNLGKETFTSLLDRILEIEPLKQLFDSLDRLENLGLHKAKSQEDWDAIRTELSDDLSELVIDYADPESQIDDLPWKKVQPFAEDIARLVDRYRGLDQKTQSLIQTIVGRVGLEPGSALRTALADIAALDPQNPDSILTEIAGPHRQETINLLELLSGWSLEDLVVDSGASRAIGEAAALAAQTGKFLSEMGDEMIGRLHDFTNRSGVESVVSWFEANATSTDALSLALEQKATVKIRTLVERLVGKAWDQLEPEDLERIQLWSQSLIDLNSKRAMVEEKLRAAVDRLAGQAGFSVGIEIGRLSERAAVLDLEIDTQNKKVRRIAESCLRGLTARELLEQLPEPKDKDDEELGYRLRDSVFSYRRVRSSSLSTFFSLMGINRARQTVRVDEEVIRIRSETGRQRQATYSTGTVRRITDHGEDALAGGHEMGVWLTHRVEGAGLDLGASYASIVEQGLQLVYSRKDNKTLPEELGALDDLLLDIGFRQVAREVAATMPDGSDPLLTEFSFKIELGADASRALLKNKTASNWNRDYLNAAHRWLDDRLVPRQAKAVSRPQPREGELLARLLEHDRFQNNWTSGLDLYLNESGEPWHVRLGEHTYRVAIATDRGQGRYNPLTSILMRRHSSTKKLGDTVDQYKLAMRDLKPQELRRLGKKFSTLLGRTPFDGWPSPLFNLWLVLARIAREDATHLNQARGLATLRYREDMDQQWQDPILWELRGANAGSEIFPF